MIPPDLSAQDEILHPHHHFAAHDGDIGRIQESVDSRWMFPSPVEEDSPIDPGAIR